MRVLADSAQMKRMDRRTIEQMGILSLTLMERAALAVAAWIRDAGMAAGKGTLVVCGTGNNGADGVAAARILHLWGFKAAFYIAGDMEKATEELKAQLHTARACHVPCFEEEPDFDSCGVLVDALFGVGLTRPVTGRYAALLERMNRAEAFRLAVDLPSGVNADNGQIPGAAFRADVTITLGCEKRGLFLYPGREYAGKIIRADIGIYPGGEAYDCYLPEEKDLDIFLQRRPDGNKGTFGKVLAVAGSESMSGAAYLCAHAALCTGAGMVKIQTSHENRIPLMALLPEAMVECSRAGTDGGEPEEKWMECLQWCDSLIIGPGLGTDSRAEERALWFLREGHALGKTMILDADGLNLLSVHPEWRKYLDERVILTPHMGEMARLTGISTRELALDRVRYARELAAQTGCVCVLKDACTVTASASGSCWISPAGNSGMATAGSGDVLAGILGGAAARFLSVPADDSEDYAGKLAACGVLLHGLCGDAAALSEGENAMTARSMILQLRKVLRKKV